MDLSTMIVDLLRGDEADKLGLSTAHSQRPASIGPAAVEALATPAYHNYKKEALANGEPVMSPEEFRRAQSEGRF